MERAGGKLKKEKAPRKPNRGREFEKEILEVAKRYEADRSMTLRKVDPPTRFIRGKIVMMANPFLDFCGSWTERGGRAVFLEAKRTDTDRLKLCCAGGLTEKQLQSLRRWRSAGAVTGIIWRSKSGDFFINMGEVESALAEGVLHIKSGEYGCSIVELDFLQAMKTVFQLRLMSEKQVVEGI